MQTERFAEMMPLTPAELNLLIFRYLNESGFSHTAFAFGFEAGISNSNINENIVVPPGALVTFIQKGIEYLGNEAKLNNGDVIADEIFRYVHPIDLLPKDVNEVQKIQKDKSKGKEKLYPENGEGSSRGIKRERDFLLEIENEKNQIEKENEYRQNIEVENDIIAKGKEKENPFDEISDEDRNGDEINGIYEENGTNAFAQPMEVCTSVVACSSTAVPNRDVTWLEGHTSEVFACAWNPTASLLASVSADSTARIWTVDQPSSMPDMQNEPSNVVLRHVAEPTNEKWEHVIALDWNVDGELLATGSYDGKVRVWSKNGAFLTGFSDHNGPIFSLKWNERGNYLLSGSSDHTAIVWDVMRAERVQLFEFHSAYVLDVDWRNNYSFATSSRDSMIYVCKVGDSRPMKAFEGHQEGVNDIEWDPTGSLLASCSDDSTVKIWTLKMDDCLLDITEHTKEVYAVRWSPTGPCTDNPNGKVVLASASFDNTIKLWDIDNGCILHTLDRHKDDIYSIAFSPNGEYLATGSLDSYLHIWSVNEGKIVKSFLGGDGIIDVSWNNKGDKVAACFADGKVCVMDFRM